jgi:hypothetical protein
MTPGHARLLIATLLLAAVPAAHAQFADMLRSVSGALRGGGGAGQQQQQGPTPTIGVRGIDEGGTVSNGAASADNQLLDGWLATRPEATHLASSKGLSARPVRFKGDGQAPLAAPANEPAKD